MHILGKQNIDMFYIKTVYLHYTINKLQDKTNPWELIMKLPGIFVLNGIFTAHLSNIAPEKCFDITQRITNQTEWTLCTIFKLQSREKKQQEQLKKRI